MLQAIFHLEKELVSTWLGLAYTIALSPCLIQLAKQAACLLPECAFALSSLVYSCGMLQLAEIGLGSDPVSLSGMEKEQARKFTVLYISKQSALQKAPDLNAPNVFRNQHLLHNQLYLPSDTKALRQ